MRSANGRARIAVTLRSKDTQRNNEDPLSDADLRAKISREPGTASPSLSLEDTSPPWSADAARPECGHYWRHPRDSEPPGHGAPPGPMCRASENHSRNTS